MFCFSDGVSLEDEAALKRRAAERELLFMGADCGTAIIDGVALGFANAVERGPVGIVGASGTGIQEVSCLLDAAGVGVSHAIGVGGRDLSARGRRADDARAASSCWPATRTRARSSRSPSRPTRRSPRAIEEAAAATGKPVVLGFDRHARGGARARAAELVGGALPALGRAAARARPSRGEVRGLYSGGTLCGEAERIVGHGDVHRLRRRRVHRRAARTR